MRGLRTDPERKEVRMLLRHAPLRGGRVLEIGCGDGRLTRRLAGALRSVVGIDPDGERIARAQRFTPPHHRGKARFEVGSGESLRFADRSFELVLFSWSL
jgi:ubiquinone/menaquinone biosynthesis C-methylase UbiE